MPLFKYADFELIFLSGCPSIGVHRPVAPITSIVRNIPSEVFLSKADGMPRDCAVNCDHLQTVSKGKIGSLIMSLSPAKMVDVGRAVCFALDI